MEYAAPVLISSNYFKTAMNGIQYKALRIIFKEPPRCSSTLLHCRAKIATIEDRLNFLATNYLKNASLNCNPIIETLIEDLKISSGVRKTPIEIIQSNSFF